MSTAFVVAAPSAHAAGAQFAITPSPAGAGAVVSVSSVTSCAWDFFFRPSFVQFTSGPWVGQRVNVDLDGNWGTLLEAPRQAGTYPVGVSCFTQAPSKTTEYDVVTLTVEPGPVDRLSLNGGSTSVSAGAPTAPYQVDGFDTFDNPLGDLTAEALLSISPDGHCDDASHVCRATVAGPHTVTAAVPSGPSVTRTLTVLAGPLDHLALDEGSTSITAGGTTAPYQVRGFDAHSNDLGDMTSQVTLTIEPDGSCDNTAHTCTATAADVSGSNHVVTAALPGGPSASRDLTVDPASAGSLTVAGYPDPTTAGVAHSVTVTAHDAFGNPASGVTVHFTSSDPQAVLPADYTFTASDAGTVTYSGVKLKTAGVQSITVIDAADPTRTATQAGITVRPAPPLLVTTSGVPSNVQAGDEFDVTVHVTDLFGNPVNGAVYLWSDDGTAMSGGAAGFPWDFFVNAEVARGYTLKPEDQGSHTFRGVALGRTAQQKGEPENNGIQLRDLPMFGITMRSTAASQGWLTYEERVDVDPGPASRLAILPGQCPNGHHAVFPWYIAGDTARCTMWALDAYENVATGYRGTVHFTSTDQQATIPADHRFTAVDAGRHTFDFTLRTAGGSFLGYHDSQDVDVDGGQSLFTIYPASPERVVVSGFPSPTLTGVAASLTVNLRDPFGNAVTNPTGTLRLTSSDPAAVLPPDLALTDGSLEAGAHTFSGVALATAGSQQITATWNGTVQRWGFDSFTLGARPERVNVNISGSQAGIVVNPAVGPLNRFSISEPRDPSTGAAITPAAGVPFTVVVTAFDGAGATKTDYTGTATLSGLEPSASGCGPDDADPCPVSAPALSFEDGVAAVTLTAYAAQVGASLTVTDTAASVTFTGEPFDVVAGGLDHLVLDPAEATVDAGDPVMYTVSGVDAYGNPTGDETGNATFAIDGEPCSDNACATTSVGTHTVRALVDGKDGQTTLTARPGPLHHFRISGPQDPDTGAQVSPVAGSPFRVTISAEDEWHNLQSDYAGRATLLPGVSEAPTGCGADGSEPCSVPVSEIDFVAGVTTATITPYKAEGPRIVTVFDPTTGVVTPGSVQFSVAPAPAARLEVEAPATAVAGVPVDVTVTAVDRYSNVATGYGGTVGFSSSDGAADLPSDSTFTSTDAGRRTVPVTLTTTGPSTVTATDGATSSITGTSGAVQVAPGPLHHFEVSAPTDPATGAAVVPVAGAAFDVTVTAYDAFGNTKSDYTGAPTLDGNLGATPTGCGEVGASPCLPSYPALAFVHGVATARVTAYRAESDRAFTVSDATATAPARSALFAVDPAPAVRIALLDAPTTVASGAATALTAAVEDSFANWVTGFVGNVAFAQSGPGTFLGLPEAHVPVSGGTASTGTVLADGLGSATLTAASGNLQPASGTITITAAPTAVVVTASASRIQYSDTIGLTATVSPASLPTGKTVAGAVRFSLHGQDLGTSPVDADGVATLDPQITLQPGTYEGTTGLTAVFQPASESVFDTSTSSMGPLTVTKEAAALLYSGEVIARAGTSLNLRATAWDPTAAGYPGANAEATSPATAGDITKLWVAFEVNEAGSCGSNAPVTTRYAPVTDTGTAGDGIGTASATYVSDGASYCVVARIVGDGSGAPNAWYGAPPAEPAGLTFYRDTGQSATGGGTVGDPGGSTASFAFNARVKKNGAAIGKLVYTYRGIYNGEQAEFSIRSTAITGAAFSGSRTPASATLEGKATIRVDRVADGATLLADGNARFTGAVADANKKRGGTSDTFSLDVFDKEGVPFHHVPSSPVQGGNVVVHKGK